MFRNYLKIFFRNMFRHWGYTVSNLSGLAVGMTTCFLILLYVHYETNWNDYNKNYKRTYRVQQKVLFKEEFSIYEQTGYQLASELKKQIPEIENSATVGYIWNEYLSTSDKLTFNEKNGSYADNNIFKVLTYEFVMGNPENALSEPFSVVISQETANKYFPGENPMGKIIKSSKNKSLKVTGVIKNLPFNIDHRPDYVVSMSTYHEVAEWKNYDKLENISSGIFYTYVTLKLNTNVNTFNEKIFSFSDKYVTNNIKKLYLKPLSEIHLIPEEKNDLEIALYYLGGFAVFVLILACINYVNLSTANSFLRKKEIGIRKVVGASRFILFFQFIGESLLTAFFAILLASILSVVLLPAFNTIVQRHIELNFIRDLNFILFIVASFIITGFLSGLYPAVYLSGFQPAHIIKGNLSLFRTNKTGSSKSILRKTLVTVQFYISIFLLISTVYVVKQVNFMKNKDLGFVKENLFVCSVFGPKTEGRFETLRNELLTNPNIVDAAISYNTPFHGNWGKDINWEGSGPTDKIYASYNQVDYNYIDTYKMQMITGRNFSNMFESDNHACIINETARRILKWDNPIGKKIDGNRYTIIGVVKDFNAFSVHWKIPAFYFTLNSGDLGNEGIYSIRIKPYGKEETIEFIKHQFRNFFPASIIDVVPFDNEINIGTKGPWEVIEKIFIGFAIIAFIMAANGLFGMISFASQRKIKEIGIRKVFGANNIQLYIMMLKEFVLMLVISAIAALISGYFMSVSTPGVYKYHLHTSDYLICAGLMFLTAFIASLYHTTKAIFANPVEVLRYE